MILLIYIFSNRITINYVMIYRNWLTTTHIYNSYIIKLQNNCQNQYYQCMVVAKKIKTLQPT
jgi:hypothetical protein